MNQPQWSTTFKYFIAVIILIAVVMVIWVIREMINPLIIAGILAYLLHPGAAFLSRKTRLPESVSVIIVYFLSLVIIISIPVIATPVIVNQVRMIELDLESLVNTYEAFRSAPFYLMQWVFYPSQVLPAIPELSFDLLTPVAESAFDIVEWVTLNFVWVLVILVTTYFLLKDGHKLLAWLFRLPPEEYQDDMRRLVKQIQKVWRDYLRSQLLFMTVVAVLFSVVWTAIGLPGGLIIGILTGIFSLIPEIGSTVAGVLAILVALVQGSTYIQLSNFWFGVLVAGIYLFLLNLKNIGIRPPIVGKIVKLNEGLVFVVVIAALVFQGVLGALIVIPVFTSLIVILRYVRRKLYGLPPFPIADQRSREQAVQEVEEEK